MFPLPRSAAPLGALIRAAAAAAPLAAGDSAANTQIFIPARYALVAAAIDTASLQPGSGGELGRRQVLVKLDTVTGRCWILQLAVDGAGNPTVTGANWAAVSEAVDRPGPMNPPQNNGGGGAGSGF